MFNNCGTGEKGRKADGAGDVVDAADVVVLQKQFRSYAAADAVCGAQMLIFL